MILENLVLEYDHDTNILTITGLDKVHIVTSDQLEALYDMIEYCLETQCAEKRGYALVDMSKLTIDYELVEDYAIHHQSSFYRWVYPEGIARYGYAITRLTIADGYRRVGEETPHFFPTRDEAVAYLRDLRQRQRSESVQV